MSDMNKTDALLWTARLHEAIRLLPDDAQIWGFAMHFDPKIGEHRIDIHLTAPVKWAAVFDGKQFDGWREKRICITPFVYAWWRADNDVA